jgi:undecaprenyl diphosphate synthase
MFQQALSSSEERQPVHAQHHAHAQPDILLENGPRHVAIIMDGNGRWAKSRHLPRQAGHKRGAETLRELIEACPGFHIKEMTVYAFSAENWQRPESEVAELMQLLNYYLEKETQTLLEKGGRLRVIGEKSRLPLQLVDKIENAEELTRKNDKILLNMCLSYGARQELTEAVRRIASDILSGTLLPEQINETIIAENLYTSHTGDPDLMIRTGGEQRLSNFLLWQSAYTELYFSEIMWPDFTAADLEKACLNFCKRERRYGLTE